MKKLGKDGQTQSNEKHKPAAQAILHSIYSDIRSTLELKPSAPGLVIVPKPKFVSLILHH